MKIKYKEFFENTIYEVKELRSVLWTYLILIKKFYSHLWLRKFQMDEFDSSLNMFVTLASLKMTGHLASNLNKKIVFIRTYLHQEDINSVKPSSKDIRKYINDTKKMKVVY